MINIKKAIIYFDDGSGLYGSGSGAGTNIKRKHGEILDISNNVVHFLEDNGYFQLIPIYRIIRIIDENRGAINY